MALVPKTALKAVLKTVLKRILKRILKKVLMTGKLTVTICLRGVRKKQRLDPTFRHFFLNVTINLQLRPVYTGSVSPNAI